MLVGIEDNVGGDPFILTDLARRVPFPGIDGLDIVAVVDRPDPLHLEGAPTAHHFKAHALQVDMAAPGRFEVDEGVLAVPTRAVMDFSTFDVPLGLNLPPP